MEFAQKWQNKSPLIRRIATWQESLWYPIVYALLCAIAGLHSKRVYLPIIGVMALLTLFSALFVRDKKVFLPPMFMSFCSLGCDNVEFTRDGQRVNVVDVFDTDALVCFCLIGAVMLLALLIRFSKDCSMLDAFRQQATFLYGLLAISAAIILNGVFSAKWRPVDTALGLFLAFGFVFIYCLVYSMIKDSHDIAAYTCFCMVCTALLVVVQVAVTVLRLHEQELLIHYYETLPPRLRRENLQLAWGYATNVAGVVVLGIPAALYLAKNKRHPIVYCLLAILFWATSVVLGTRSAFLVGALVLLTCISLACLKGRNAKILRLVSIIMILSGILFLLYADEKLFSLHELADQLLNFLRLDNLDELDRFGLWINGWNDFLESPLFGVGFSDGGVDVKTEVSNLFADMYHNVVIEFLGAMGAVGMLAFLWHVKDLLVCLFRRFSVNKLLLLLLPFTILATSLADNFFFYINFQLFYCPFLILAERES